MQKVLRGLLIGFSAIIFSSAIAAQVQTFDLVSSITHAKVGTFGYLTPSVDGARAYVSYGAVNGFSPEAFLLRSDGGGIPEFTDGALSGFVGGDFDISGDYSGADVFAFQTFGVAGSEYSYTLSAFDNRTQVQVADMRDHGVVVFTPAVPEPATFVQLLLGLSALVLIQRQFLGGRRAESS